MVGSCAQSDGSPTPTQVGSPSNPTPTSSAPAGGPPCQPPASLAARPWWGGQLFYEVFVRSFQDSNGDGIGDLNGLTSRLDALNDGDPTTPGDLGVTALWLMPIAESPSYHGYDVTDYEAIEPDYGTADDLRALVAAAHERGIKVIVDLVMNHTSIQHPWFQDALTPGSAHDDWYVWSDTRPAIARSDGTPVWHEANGRYYYAYFWEGMPDLNLRNPAVTAALDGIAGYWLDEMGVDGFRLDAAKHLIEDGKQLENTPETFAWLQGFRERLHATHPDALVLGEVYDASIMSARYVQEGSLDLTFDFDLASATITSLNSRDAGSIAAALKDAAAQYPPDTMATFLTNHDQNRVASQLAGDPDAERLAAGLLLMGPGVPFIYYGEEIGMTGTKPDEQIRTPLRWDATSPAGGFSTVPPWETQSFDPAGTDVATEAADPGSLLNWYRTLAHLRLRHPALASGGLVPVATADRSVVAFLRTTDEAMDLVLANLGPAPIATPRLTLKSGPLCGEPTASMILGDGPAIAPDLTPAGGFADWAPVATLGAKSIVVVELRP